MVENKLKESIRVAEEMAHEWCTGEETDSALLRAWKQQSPQLYRATAPDNNGGTLRFYEVDDSNSGMSLTLKEDVDENGETRVWKYDGYAKIKDVRYKEPR